MRAADPFEHQTDALRWAEEQRVTNETVADGLVSGKLADAASIALEQGDRSTHAQLRRPGITCSRHDGFAHLGW